MTPTTFADLSRNIGGFGLALLIGWFFYKSLKDRIQELTDENKKLKEDVAGLTAELRAGAATVKDMWLWFQAKDDRDQMRIANQDNRMRAQDTRMDQQDKDLQWQQQQGQPGSSPRGDRP